MKHVVFCVVFLTMGLAYGEVPKLFTQKSFNSANLAEAVNRYVAIGEASSLKEFRQLSEAEAGKTELFAGKGFSVNERIGWVCRILYQPRGHSPLRAPKFGILSLPENTMPAEKWPLYPLVFSGSTYFVLRQGYTPDGEPEEMSHYLEYCKKNGVFRTTPVVVPTLEQAREDAADLRKSLQWQAIQWENNDGNNFPMGEQLTWSFIQLQTRTIQDESLAKRHVRTDFSAVTLR